MKKSTAANDRRRRSGNARTLSARLAGPAWLDGQTAAVVGTVVTVGIAISGMILATNAATRQELQNVRAELSARSEGVRRELLAEIRALDGRLRTVELDVVAIRTALGATASRDADDRQDRPNALAPSP